MCWYWLGEKLANKYFVNLISGQSKVLSIFQILIFAFALKVIIVFFIVPEMHLTSINPCLCTRILSGHWVHLTRGGVSFHLISNTDLEFFNYFCSADLIHTSIFGIKREDKTSIFILSGMHNDFEWLYF